MWEKFAISIAKAYAITVFKEWLADKKGGKLLGKKDVRNLEEVIKAASLLLAANEDNTVLDVALLKELGGVNNV